jgi:fructose-1,6-bisphosphatase/inositol monophosphatase family enzyme
VGEDRGVLVVLDPLDGSTNAAHGIPWFATSLCAVDGDGPRVALVVDQARGVRFHAIRGGRAKRDGREMRPSGRRALGDAVVALSGWPGRHLGWRQYRVLGAAALDLCAVAGGVVDAYLGCDGDGLGPWDYLAGMLICQEAGAEVADAEGRDLVALTHEDRRTPVAAATPELLRALVRSRWEGTAAAPGGPPGGSERKTS